MASKKAFKIGIVGCGKMGKDIFTFLSAFDFKLILVCKSDTQVEHIRKSFLKKQNRLLKYASIDKDQYDEKLRQVLLTTSLETLSDCDLIIESITENVGLKKDLFSELDSILQPECVLVSNTSSIPLRELMTGNSRMKYLVGLHFFYPVLIKNLVEVNILNDTSKKTSLTINSFLAAINKNPIVLSEENHFLVNRLLLRLQAGCCSLVKEGNISVRELDMLIKEHFFPIGVFEFMDHVGIDTMLYSVQQYVKTLPDREFYQPLIQMLEQLKLNDKLGLRTKEGFYTYPIVQADDSKPITLDAEKTILKKLVVWYLHPFLETLQEGVCNREELDQIAGEYLSVVKSPFELAQEYSYKL